MDYKRFFFKTEVDEWKYRSLKRDFSCVSWWFFCYVWSKESKWVEGAHDKGRDCPGLFCIVEIISKGLCTPLNKWWLSWDFFTWVASRAKRHTCELGKICSWDYSRTNGASKLTLWVNKVELQEHIVKSFQWCPGDKWFSKWVRKWWGVSTFEGTPTCEAFLHTFNMKICTHKTHLEMELLCSCSLTSKVVQCNAMKFTKI
jgi:hypothetical protein